MKIHSVRQRSVDWHKLRRGIPTASNFDKIILPSGKRSGQARKYMHQLAYERIMDKDAPRPNLGTVAHIQYGISNEDIAVEAFERQTGHSTSPIGLITDDRESMGCSPDRIVLGGRSAALEIKCPQGPTQCGYLIDGLGDAYMAQLQGQILIGGFELVHFYSWSEELPAYYVQVEPDETFQRLLAQYLDEFNRELMLGATHIRSLGHWPKNAPSVFPEDDPDEAA